MEAIDLRRVTCLAHGLFDCFGRFHNSRACFLDITTDGSIRLILRFVRLHRVVCWWDHGVVGVFALGLHDHVRVERSRGWGRICGSGCRFRSCVSGKGGGRGGCLVNVMEKVWERNVERGGFISYQERNQDERLYKLFLRTR